jgi:oxalate decarboxylase/phosphoglucose isomerase-like protein (cupin superfamily)
MANISLAPGERFEHYHSSESETRLEAGQAQLLIQSLSPITMQVGQLIRVPAETPHIMINTGTVVATVYCGAHGPSY